MADSRAIAENTQDGLKEQNVRKWGDVRGSQVPTERNFNGQNWNNLNNKIK